VIDVFVAVVDADNSAADDDAFVGTDDNVDDGDLLFTVKVAVLSGVTHVVVAVFDVVVSCGIIFVVFTTVAVVVFVVVVVAFGIFVFLVLCRRDSRNEERSE
jgi:hypothetical protein